MQSQSFNFGATPSLDTIFKTNDITPQIQKHLSLVYQSLALTILSSVIGCLFQMETNLGGIFTSLLAIGSIFYLAFDSDKSNYNKRMSVLLAFGFFKGMSLGHLVEFAIEVDPSILVSALVGTLAIFCCFSAAALVAKRRSYLYVGAMCSSLLFYIALGSFINIFIGSYFFFDVSLYAGLFAFLGYVVYDTQIIIEKASVGRTDAVWDALELFIDFVAIFVRILIILLKNSQKKEQNKKRKD